MLGPKTLHRFSVEDFYHMREMGIPPPNLRAELLDGQIYQICPIVSRYQGMVDRLAKQFERLFGDAATIQFREPVVVSDFTQAEPEFTFLRPRDDSYSERPAAPEDVLLFVYVAGPSLVDNAKLVDLSAKKGELYAQARIPEFWFLDLKGRCMLVQRDPKEGRYADVRTLSVGRIVPLAFPGMGVDINELFGPVVELEEDTPSIPSRKRRDRRPSDGAKRVV